MAKCYAKRSGLYSFDGMKNTKIEIGDEFTGEKAQKLLDDDWGSLTPVRKKVKTAGKPAGKTAAKKAAKESDADQESGDDNGADDDDGNGDDDGEDDQPRRRK